MKNPRIDLNDIPLPRIPAHSVGREARRRFRKSEMVRLEKFFTETLQPRLEAQYGLDLSLGRSLVIEELEGCIKLFLTLPAAAMEQRPALTRQLKETFLLQFPRCNGVEVIIAPRDGEA